MGYEVPLFNITLIAAADLTAKQYHAVKVDANGQGALAGTGENGIGILQNVPDTGQAATVTVQGISKAIYGDAVTAGQDVMVDANGQIVPYADPGVEVTHYKVGTALTSGAAGEEGTILLKCNSSVTGA